VTPAIATDVDVAWSLRLSVGYTSVIHAHPAKIVGRCDTPFCIVWPEVALYYKQSIDQFSTKRGYLWGSELRQKCTVSRGQSKVSSGVVTGGQEEIATLPEFWVVEEMSKDLYVEKISLRNANIWCWKLPFFFGGGRLGTELKFWALYNFVFWRWQCLSENCNFRSRLLFLTDDSTLSLKTLAPVLRALLWR